MFEHFILPINSGESIKELDWIAMCSYEIPLNNQVSITCLTNWLLKYCFPLLEICLFSGVSRIREKWGRKCRFNSFVGREDPRAEEQMDTSVVLGVWHVLKPDKGRGWSQHHRGCPFTPSYRLTGVCEVSKIKGKLHLTPLIPHSLTWPWVSWAAKCLKYLLMAT